MTSSCFFQNFDPNHHGKLTGKMFKDNLQDLAKHKGWFKVNPNDGTIEKIGFFGKVWQVLSGVFGGVNHSKDFYVNLQFMNAIKFGLDKKYIDQAFVIQHFQSKPEVLPASGQTYDQLIKNFEQNHLPEMQTLNKVKEVWHKNFGLGSNRKPTTPQPGQNLGAQPSPPIPVVQPLQQPNVQYPGQPATPHIPRGHAGHQILPQQQPPYRQAVVPNVPVFIQPKPQVIQNRAPAPAQVRYQVPQQVQPPPSQVVINIPQYPQAKSLDEAARWHSAFLDRKYRTFQPRAKQLVQQQGLDPVELKKIYEYLNRGDVQNWIKDEIAQSKKEGRTEQFIYLRPKDTNINYSLMVNREGRIIILPPHKDNKKAGYIKPLGKGSFKEVSVAIDFQTGDILAIAHADVSQKDKWNALQKEIYFQQLFSGSHEFVRVYTQDTHETKTHNQQGRIVMECCVGDLESITDGFEREVLMLDGTTRQPGPPKNPIITQDEIHLMFFDLLMGLVWMESKGICHYDIKPGNVMYTLDDYGQISGAKIADFGGALDVTSHPIIDSAFQIHTPLYASPEFLAAQQSSNTQLSASTAYDMFSMGATLAHLVGFNLDFQNVRNIPELRTKMATFATNYNSPQMQQFFNQSGEKFLIGKMLDPNPNTRIRALEASYLLRYGLGEKRFYDLHMKKYGIPPQYDTNAFYNMLNQSNYSWFVKNSPIRA